MLLPTQGCCPADGRPMPQQFDYAHQYELVLNKVNDSQAISLDADKRYRSFDDDNIRVRVRTWSHNFWIDVTNKMSTPIRISLPQSLYVDELNRSHAVYEGQPLDPEQPQPAVVIQPRSKLAQIELYPQYKTYPVREHCFSDVKWLEPLVPTSFEGQSHDTTRAYLKKMFDNRQPVKLRLALETGNVKKTYVLSFVLADRYAGTPGSIDGPTPIGESMSSTRQLPLP
jgi:hypothetical protein